MDRGKESTALHRNRDALSRRMLAHQPRQRCGMWRSNRSLYKRPEFLGLIALLGLTGCASTNWEYPYPPTPNTVPASEKKWYSKGGEMRYDAAEIDPKNKEAFEVIDEEVADAVEGHPRSGEFGFVHTVWETKRRILYWKYGIDWHGVQDMTPGLMID